MYHGIPLDYHLFVFVFAILAWAGRLLYKGFQRISRQVRGVSPSVPKPSPIQQTIAGARQWATLPQPEATPPSPGIVQTPPKSAQALPYRTAPLVRAREMPRRPEAGGPAVPREATEDERRRQERELFASEPSALAVPLKDSLPITAAAETPRALFGDTDDLVRAIILQEVLGPPLSRRSSQTSAPPPR